MSTAAKGITELNRQGLRVQKQPIRLSSCLGSGGEGGVYAIAGSEDRVAKLYHQALDKNKSEKLEVMAENKGRSLLKISAWPLEVVTDKNGRTRGFVMGRLDREWKPVVELYNPGSRRKSFPQTDWRFLVRAALNTARAFGYLHRHHCIVGDVNYGNLLVDNQARTKFIDCDSFQFKFKGKLYTCDVGVVDFTPPELQNESLKAKARYERHDCFGLAVIVFLLLFMGRHPFAGVWKGAPGQEPALPTAIARCLFAYSSRHTLLTPPPVGLRLDHVGPRAAQLFERAFTKAAPGKDRPSAVEWIECLSRLEKELVQCRRSHQHYYPGSIGNCPWCEQEARGIVLFEPASRLVPFPPGGASADPRMLMAAIRAVDGVGQVPALHCQPPSEASKAAMAAANRSRLARLSFGFTLAAGVSMIILSLALRWITDSSWFWILVATPVVAMAIHRIVRPNLAPFREEYLRAEATWNTYQDKWEAEAGEGAFKEKLADLDAAFEQLQKLAEFRTELVESGTERKRKDALVSLLRTERIDSGKVPGIGQSRAATLGRHGVISAYDITSQKISGIPGFGPGLCFVLLNWRSGLETHFRYGQGRRIILSSREIQAIDREVESKRLALTAELARGPETLRAMKRSVDLKRQGPLRAEAEAAGAAYFSAKLDLEKASLA